MCVVVSAGEIAKLFPCVFGQPSAMVVPGDSTSDGLNQKLKIGVVLSGGQAPGGHNVIAGIFGENHIDLMMLCSILMRFLFQAIDSVVVVSLRMHL